MANKKKNAKHTIISKRTSPFTYTKWVKVNGQFFQDKRGVVINGGAGVVGGSELLSGRPLEKRSLLVPASVMTFVDDEVLEYLMSVPKFRRDIERGLIVVIKDETIDQDKADEIAAKDMIDDDHIPTRPVTEEEIEKTGASINKDGSVDISDVDEDMSPLKVRKQDAGQPYYVKKRNAEKRRKRK